MVEQGPKGWEFGAGVSLTLWLTSQAAETLWLSWCGVGKEWRRARVEQSPFLFSQRSRFCAPVPCVRNEVFIFFLFLLVLGLVRCRIAVFALAAGGSIDKGSRRTDIIFPSSRRRGNNKAELETAGRVEIPGEC